MTAEETAAKIISKVGLWWPLAEEDQLRTAAGGYEECAKSVRAAAATGTAGAKLVTGGNTGEAIDAFSKFWADYDGDGDAGLPATAQAAENVAKALRDFAQAVDDAKRKIINLAIEIGATIAVGVGMALFTFGGSAAAASARTAMLVARGWMIARGLSAVAAKIVTRFLATVVFGAVEGFTSSIVAQTAQVALTDGDGISLSKAMDWAKWGAVTAPVALGAGVAIRSGYRAVRSGRSAVTPTHGLPGKGPGNVKPAGGVPAGPPKGLPGSSGSGEPPPKPPGGGAGAGDGAPNLHRQLADLLAKRKQRLEHLGTDPKTGTYRPHEAEVGAKIEKQYGGFRRDPTGDAEWISNSGPYQGKTFDAVGLPQGTSKFHGTDMRDFLPSIDTHFRKDGLDYVVLDVRYMSPAQRTTVMDYIAAKWASQRDRLIVLE